MKLLLSFDSITVKKPIISKVTLESGALINILRASVGARKGEIIIEVPEEKVEIVEKILKAEGVFVSELKKAVEKNEERCVHCGACISVCPTEAIRKNEENKVIVEEKLCIHCGTCVTSCPTQALNLPSI